MTTTYISGNTYPVKDQLKALGCRWDAKRKAWYTASESVAAKAKALVEPHPFSAPAAPVAPAALAVKHGRTAVEGATVVSFSCYGLPSGDNGLPNGSIRRVKAVRYVQVARTKREYLSADWLDDMDMSYLEAGGSYRWDGVPVVDTPAELAADAQRVSDRESKERVVKKFDWTVEEILKRGTHEPGSRGGWKSAENGETVNLQQPRPAVAPVATWHIPHPRFSSVSTPTITLFEGDIIGVCSPNYDDSPSVAWLHDPMLAVEIRSYMTGLKL